MGSSARIDFRVGVMSTPRSNFLQTNSRAQTVGIVVAALVSLAGGIGTAFDWRFGGLLLAVGLIALVVVSLLPEKR